MNRFFSIFSLAIMAFLSLQAGEVTFDFSTAEGITAMGYALPEPSAGTNLTQAGPKTVDGVTLSATDGATQTRIWNSQGSYTLRIYVDGSITLSVAEGSITGITVNAANVNNFDLIADVGDYTADGTVGTWTGSETSVTLTHVGSKNAQVASLVVTTSSEGPVNPDPDGPIDPNIHKLDSLQHLADLEDGTAFQFTSDVYVNYQWNDHLWVMQLDEEGYAYDSSPAMTNAVVPMIGRAYGAFFREKEGIAYCEQRGQLLAAAALCQTKTYADEAEANRLLAKVLDDEKQPVDSRRAAYEKLFARDFARGDRYYDLYVSGNYRNTNGAVRAFCNSITANGEGFGFYGKYDGLLHVYEKYLRPLLDADHRATDYAVAQYVLYAYCSFGRFADAAATARHIVETSPKLAPAERYHLLLAAELLPCEGDAAKLKAAIAKADAALADDVPPADRVAKIQSVGCAAMIGNREDLVRALEEYRKALYVPQPKKRYTVRFSERQVLGADSWDSLPFKPEEQPMDRVYGGSMDFLKTDVATGDRGEGVGGASDGKAISFPTLSAVADVQGIHFRFVAPNPRAREVENRMLEGGSYEGYIAPGANQPYICFLGRMSTGAFTLYNTAYDSPNHRRIPTEDHSLYRSQISYSDDAITTYFMLSWDAYATLIPEKGTVWDFENINWRKPGSACWNGTESIHGRSTWGELVFDISDKDRIAILRRILFKVVADYKA